MLEKNKVGPCSKGPYSYGIKVGSTIYISGMTGIDLSPKSLKYSDFKSQLIQILENIEVILGKEDLTLNQVVKVNIQMTDEKHLSVLNQVMSLYFTHPYPVRNISITGLLDGALVQLDAVAYDTRESDYKKMILEDDCGGEGC